MSDYGYGHGGQRQPQKRRRDGAVQNLADILGAWQSRQLN